MIFWRIMGYLFFDDREHFVVKGEKRFDQAAIEAFACDKGFAFYDTATKVRRLKGNASDAFLEISGAHRHSLPFLPSCPPAIISLLTGGLAGETLCRTLGVEHLPKIGESVLCPQAQHSFGARHHLLAHAE